MSLDRRKFFAVGGGVAAAAGLASTGTAAAKGTNERLIKPSLPGFTSNFLVANGIRQYYVAGGQGEPLILLHGWPQTWWEYHKVMPALAERFRVIAVDLRGIGGTDKPQSGYDKKTMARDIYELARKLGYSSVNIAGHDVGSMVAFSFAANHPAATRKVALLDVLHPDESYYEYRLMPQPGAPFHLWWFAFNQVRGLPEQLVTGRGRYLVDWMLDALLVNPAAINDYDRTVYGQNYSYPDAIRGGNSWYQAFGQDIVDLKDYGPVTAPMLGLAHNNFFPNMAAKLPTQGTNVQVAEIANAGHYFVEEQPAEVIRHLTAFFG
jgi:pimeloyl-ACP methyl ester carboxylesterase